MLSYLEYMVYRINNMDVFYELYAQYFIFISLFSFSFLTDVISYIVVSILRTNIVITRWWFARVKK